jgi:hypothetical protein
MARQRKLWVLVLTLVIAVIAAVIAVTVYFATAHSDNYNKCIAMTKEESHNYGRDWDKTSAEHFCTQLYGR